MRRLTLWSLLAAGLSLIALSFALIIVVDPIAAQEDDGETEVVESADSAEESAPVALLEYVGSRECRDCHRSTYSAFRSTNHSLTLRELRTEEDRSAVVGDFSVGEAARTVQFPGEAAPRPFTLDDVAYTLGAGRGLQAYLYARDTGDYIVFPAEWDVVNQQWVELELAETWPDAAYEFGPKCAGCHTVGLSIQTYEWQEAGVQCETCHGPGSAHVDAADAASRRPSDEELAGIRQAIASGLDPQSCGQCHNRGMAPDGVHPYPVGYLPGMDLLDPSVFNLVSAEDAAHWWPTGHARQPNMQFNEWHVSTHARALQAVQEADGADDSCLVCHSGDYLATAKRIAQADAGEWRGAAPESVTLATAQHGLTCTTCHNPHSDAGHDFQLVSDSYTLCTACHAQTETPLEFIHHPAREMFEGITLIPQVEGVVGAHFVAADGPDCQTCHMPSVPVGKKQRVSHTLSVILPGDVAGVEGLYDGCTTCHTEHLDGAGIQRLVDDMQADVQARLQAAQAAVSPGSAQWVRDALDFIEGDGSLGMHNYAYTLALLSASEKELGLVPGDIAGRAQILSTREVLERTREAVRSDTVILGLTWPELLGFSAAGLILLVSLVFVVRGMRLPGVLSLIVAVAVAAGVLILREPVQAVEITGANSNCLFCHAGAPYSFVFADGTALNLRVDVERMADSVHTKEGVGPFGCLDCHSEDIFPHQSVSFASRGAYRVEMSSVCISCHLKDTEHYEAVLARNILVGCSDCHTSHYVEPASQLRLATVFRP